MTETNSVNATQFDRLAILRIIDKYFRKGAARDRKARE